MHEHLEPNEMLLRATFRNILSFKEEVAVSFTAGKSNVIQSHVCRAVKRDDISVLKAGIIYGANASGKSNVIKAISVLQDIALGAYPRQKMEPFRLSSVIEPVSKIELEFKVDSRYYAYGMEMTLQGIREEWLYEINVRTEKEVFSRKATEDGFEYTFGTIDGGASARQLLRFLSHGTPKDKSFLSEYIDRNGEGLDSIRTAYGWFADRLHIIFPDTRYNGLSYRIDADESFSSGIKAMLGYFGTGIHDIRRIPVKLEETELSRETLDGILAKAKRGETYAAASPQGNSLYYITIGEDGQYGIQALKAVHIDEKNKEVVFEIKQESDGSIRLLDFIPMLLDLLHNPCVYFIDEIDRSIHPMLSQKLIECYTNSLAGDRDTQLIFTTHESNLLNLELIRPDEVWFIEKDKAGSSHATALSEFKPREDVRKGYLQGRYGAIPFFASLKSLKW